MNISLLGYFGRLKDKIFKCLDKKNRHTLKFATNAQLLFLETKRYHCYLEYILNLMIT